VSISQDRERFAVTHGRACRDGKIGKRDRGLSRVVERDGGRCSSETYSVAYQPAQVLRDAATARLCALSNGID
jgi:hypothetical protein